MSTTYPLTLVLEEDVLTELDKYVATRKEDKKKKVIITPATYEQIEKARQIARRSVGEANAYLRSVQYIKRPKISASRSTVVNDVLRAAFKELGLMKSLGLAPPEPETKPDAPGAKKPRKSTKKRTSTTKKVAAADSAAAPAG